MCATVGLASCKRRLLTGSARAGRGGARAGTCNGDTTCRDNFYSDPVAIGYYKDHVKMWLNRRNTLTGRLYRCGVHGRLPPACYFPSAACVSSRPGVRCRGTSSHAERMHACMAPVLRQCMRIMVPRIGTAHSLSAPVAEASAECVRRGRARREDPSIFGYNLMNEPRSQSQLYIVTRQTTDGSRMYNISYNPGDDLQAWIEESASFIKAIDPIHLLSTGAPRAQLCRVGQD